MSLRRRQVIILFYEVNAEAGQVNCSQKNFQTEADHQQADQEPEVDSEGSRQAKEAQTTPAVNDSRTECGDERSKSKDTLTHCS